MNLRELLVGNPVRLRYVKRFSTCHVVHQESVAEHSYYVAFYGMVLSDWVNANRAIGSENGCSAELVMRRAIIHDVEECITGDINRPFKHSSGILKDTLHEAGYDVLDDALRFADEAQFNWYRTLWAQSKDFSVEGSVIEFADFLSVLSYMVQELDNANATMRQNWETMREYYDYFSMSKFNFMRELVDEAGILLRESFRVGTYE